MPKPASRADRTAATRLPSRSLRVTVTAPRGALSKWMNDGFTGIACATIRVSRMTVASEISRGFSSPGEDRKSVVSGKSVSVRVDLGGRRIHKNKRVDRLMKYKTFTK